MVWNDFSSFQGTGKRWDIAFSFVSGFPKSYHKRWPFHLLFVFHMQNFIESYRQYRDGGVGVRNLPVTWPDVRIIQPTIPVSWATNPGEWIACWLQYILGRWVTSNAFQSANPRRWLAWKLYQGSRLILRLRESARESAIRPMNEFQLQTFHHKSSLPMVVRHHRRPSDDIFSYGVQPGNRGSHSIDSDTLVGWVLRLVVSPFFVLLCIS